MNQEQHDYDVAVIGFGKAGKTIARKRAEAGDSVVLFEQSPRMYGGTCINVGCVPTKKLLFEAHKTTGSDARARWEEIKEARNALVSTMNEANLDMVEQAGVKVVTARAKFVGAREIEADQQRYRAKTVIINTGASARTLDIPGIDDPRVVDSTGVQFLEQLPKQLLIVGGGPIAMEFASLFISLDVQVRMLDQSPQFGGPFDRDVADAVLEHLQDQGLEFIASADVQRIDADEQLKVHATVDGAERSFDADAVLVAIGRQANTQDLGLEHAGVDVDDRGSVVVDKHLHTSADGVYAVGDVNGGPQFTYISFDDHRVVLDDRWGEGARDTADRVIPTATYIDPPLATVGRNEAQLEREGISFEAKKAKIADIAVMPRPKIVEQTTGMAKFLIGEDDQILGATLWCVDSQEIINTVALAMRVGMTATELGGQIITHPANSEVLNGVLG
ncbi:dihydrolipoyl dehydrogenase family protein [Corynebacterium pelargi]|uniref:dihydrolipoyl dehydrogenase family protein n=1 Tax=Corynebacterium pelargi TaxID=1471400 RepID=UPI001986A08A|nr:FAD-dependent oxidoreductase [Corynebacterium pelargi]GGG71024.1 mercuric reductase [Corynebacterium pelargi]